MHRPKRGQALNEGDLLFDSSFDAIFFWHSTLERLPESEACKVVKLVLAAVGRRKAHREIAQHPELGRDLLHRTSIKVLVGSERIQNLIELDLNHARRLSRNRCNAINAHRVV